MIKESTPPTSADVVRVLESAIAAKNQAITGKIEDIKDTITHSTWLAVVAVGILAAVATIVSPSQCIWVQAAGAFSITAASLSIFYSMRQSALSNTLLYLNRQIILGNRAIQTEILASRPMPPDLEIFSQQIIKNSVGSGGYRSQISALQSGIESHGDTERHVNLQAKTLLTSVIFFGIAAILPSFTSHLQPCTTKLETPSNTNCKPTTNTKP